MGWRGQHNRDLEEERRWRELPLQERYDWTRIVGDSCDPRGHPLASGVNQTKESAVFSQATAARGAFGGFEVSRSAIWPGEAQVRKALAQPGVFLYFDAIMVVAG